MKRPGAGWRIAICQLTRALGQSARCDCLTRADKIQEFHHGISLTRPTQRDPVRGLPV